jgi:octaprenyl-diphosphate synthase
VLAGDFALAEALCLVERSQLPHVMPDFLRTIRVLVRGESLETLHKFDFDINEATYYEIISEKSASLFSLSCKIGALSYKSEYADKLGHFGWNLGMAFQMIDDLDDMLAHPNQTLDCDLQNGYLSLPVIKALVNLEDGHRDRLVKIIKAGNLSLSNEFYIVSLCNEIGTIQQSNDTIHKHLNNAAEILGRFKKCEAKELLSFIIDDLRAYTNNQIDNFQKFTPSAGG